jgi:hypothetical protein
MSCHLHTSANKKSPSTISVLGLNLFPVCDLSFVNPQRESTVRVRAYPGLEENRSPFLPIIRERDQYARLTFLAFWETRKIHHPTPFSEGPNFLPSLEKIKRKGATLAHFL